MSILNMSVHRTLLLVVTFTFTTCLIEAQIPAEKCPNNEEYVSCVLGECKAKLCSDIGKSLPCPRIRPPCAGGCLCKEGYLRNSEGICVPQEQCPEQCSVNQTYVSCNVRCPNDYCPKDDEPQPVCDPPRLCPPGCHCKLNYRIGAEGNCILAPECPPIDCTRPNEIFDSCPSACLAENCEDVDNQPSTCNTLVLNCDPRCVCSKGYFRNELGICIPAKECPPSAEPGSSV